MNRLFLLLFGAVSLVAHAQVPDYVPTEGLVAWYPFNGNANDESGNGNNFNSGDYSFVEDQSNANSEAIAFNQLNSAATTSLPNSFMDSQEATYSFWWRIEGAYNYNGYNLLTFPGSPGSIGGNFLAFTIDENWYWLGCENSSSGYTATARIGYDFHIRALDCATYPEMSSWNHTVVTCTSNSLKLYFNGIFIGEESVAVDFGQSPEGTLSLGVHNNPSQSSLTVRIMDDLGLWNRALTEEEILALYNAEPPVTGCTDSTACNFDAEATSDDGSCIPSGCMDSEACNYNALAECESEACDYSCCPGPGCCAAGTSWDYSLEQCVPTESSCSDDLDGDGVIGVNDLMQLLSSFGTDCTPAEEPETTEFTCGDPVSYHGYDYATVQIGEQCWFAENLRTDTYTDGTEIPAGLTDEEWTSTTNGGTTVYGEGNSDCEDFSPDIDPCDEVQSLAAYGRLYNWYAVNDARGLCPASWQVPTDEEWTELEDFITSQGFAGTEGTALKSTTGWHNGGNGTDYFGFSAVSGGNRAGDNGRFNSGGRWSGWWGSTSDGSNAWYRSLYYVSPDINRDAHNPRYGFSVRCLKY